MKKNITSLLFAIGGILLSTSSWSQCPTISCPSDTTIYNVANNCSAVFSYPLPGGSDPCEVVADTFQYSGSIVSWVVPAGVTSINVEARGAAGSYNTSSSVVGGLGAIVSGDLSVTPGETLYLLVGQTYSITSGAGGNGGGGGTFVVDALNNPLMIAGGGGGSGGGSDSPAKHGQVGTTGGTGSGGGGLGGSNGNGGSIGATFASGAGGGLLTDGADGWTANSGGDAFVNGGAGANVGFGIGGFGGGGNGSGYVVGGGGGGYSGGGAASNSSGGGGVGGGGASYNGGTNQVNTAGANNGHGMIVITYGGATTTSFVSGIGSGNEFPIGTTTESFVAVNAMGDSAYCSFNVTVIDTLTIPASLGAFGQDSICVYNDPIALPVGTPAGGTYSGNGVSGMSFDPSLSGVGSHTVTYTYVDSITGCTTEAMSSIIVDGCAGLLDIQAPNNLSIYPNPNNGNFSISFDNGTNELTSIEVSDLHGRVVYSTSSNEAHISYSIDIRNEASGVYLLKISSDSHSYTQKIVKE